MEKIWVHLSCHTHFTLFWSFNGGKVLVVEQVQFFWHVHYSLLGDWTSFIFTNHSTHVSHITHMLLIALNQICPTFQFRTFLPSSLVHSSSHSPSLPNLPNSFDPAIPPPCLISGWSTSCWSLAFAWLPSYQQPKCATATPAPWIDSGTCLHQRLLAPKPACTKAYLHQKNACTKNLVCQNLPKPDLTNAVLSAAKTNRKKKLNKDKKNGSLT